MGIGPPTTPKLASRLDHSTFIWVIENKKNRQKPTSQLRCEVCSINYSPIPCGKVGWTFADEDMHTYMRK